MLDKHLAYSCYRVIFMYSSFIIYILVVMVVVIAWLLYFNMLIHSEDFSKKIQQIEKNYMASQNN